MAPDPSLARRMVLDARSGLRDALGIGSARLRTVVSAGQLRYRRREDLLVATGHRRHENWHFADAAIVNAERRIVPAVADARVAPLHASSAVVLAERPNPHAARLDFGPFAGRRIVLSGYHRPTQPPLLVLEYRDVCLATTGDLFAIFSGDTFDPASSALIENPARACRTTVPLDTIALCDDYFAGSTNIAHFLGDRMPRVAMMGALLGLDPDLCALGGARTPYPAFVRERMFPRTRLLRPDTVYRVARLVLLSSSTRPDGHPFHFLHPAGLEALERRLLSRLETPPVRRRKLYLSRLNRPGRRMVNEAALAERLAGLGFEIMAMDALAPEDQLRAIREALIVVAPHGAALTSVIAAAPGTPVVEIFNPLAGTACFMVCAALAGADHRPLFGEPLETPGISAPWRAPVEEIVRHL